MKKEIEVKRIVIELTNKKTSKTKTEKNRYIELRGLLIIILVYNIYDNTHLFVYYYCMVLKEANFFYTTYFLPT